MRTKKPDLERRRLWRLMLMLLVAFGLGGYYTFQRLNGPDPSAADRRIAELTAQRDRVIEEQKASDKRRKEFLTARVSGDAARPRDYAELASLLSSTEPEKARKLLETATRRFPKSVSLWAGLGRVHQQQLRPDRALLAFRKANSLDPTNPLVAAALTNLYTTLAWATEARTVLNPALKKHPNDPSLRMSLARLEQQTGNSKASRLAVEPLCAGSEVPSQAYVLLAQALVREGNRKAALEAYGKALAREPWSDEIRCELADTLVALGDRDSLEQAEAVLREAMKVQPGPALSRSLGIVLARRNRHADALDLLLPMAKDPAADSQLLSTAAGSLRALARGEEAAALNQRANEASQSEGEMLGLLTRANFQPQDPEPPFALAQLYLRQNREDFARAEVLRALWIRPTHPGARELARKLDVSTELRNGLPQARSRD